MPPEREPAFAENGEGAVRAVARALEGVERLDDPGAEGLGLGAVEPVARPLLFETARDVEVRASLTDEFGGVERPDSSLEGGDCLRVVFERRKLRPW